MLDVNSYLKGWTYVTNIWKNRVQVIVKYDIIEQCRVLGPWNEEIRDL